MTNYDRQSFLGVNAQQVFSEACIGLIGYSGGGSHIGQQLGHVGIGKFIVVDPKTIKATHLPRFVGGEKEDVQVSRLKVDIAEREIKKGNPKAVIKKFQKNWVDVSGVLLECDIIFGAVDSYLERIKLEQFCRRNMIPFIDIGMDVKKLSDGKHLISGQVIQSLPGGHCINCCGFITSDMLRRETEAYGNAGEAPQVIWANGVLASTAVGWGISLLSPWQSDPKLFRWLCYDGNTGELKNHPLISEVMKTPCTHYPIVEVGGPLCDIREFDPNAHNI